MDALCTTVQRLFSVLPNCSYFSPSLNILPYTSTLSLFCFICTGLLDGEQRKHLSMSMDHRNEASGFNNIALYHRFHVLFILFYFIFIFFLYFFALADLPT